MASVTLQWVQPIQQSEIDVNFSDALEHTSVGQHFLDCLPADCFDYGTKVSDAFLCGNPGATYA